LKELRKNKNVSQEKFAEYLGVSYQAVSKWENGVTSPDILLLPDIARYYGITVDELLRNDTEDADSCYGETCRKAEELFRNGKREELIPLWREAYKKLPCDIRIKEMLMSALFDTDKVKYAAEIIELASEIYFTDSRNSGYYKGQAITEAAQTYHAIGNEAKADEWARRAFQLNHCQEMLFMQIHDEDDWLTDTFSFANYWYLDMLFVMAARLNSCGVKRYGDDYVQNVNKAAAKIYEAVYPDDDMSFESLTKLCVLHRCIAEDETTLTQDEEVVKKHLTRAIECAVRSAEVKAHELTHPLVYGMRISDAPSDNMQTVRMLKNELMMECFDPYRDKRWFAELSERLEYSE